VGDGFSYDGEGAQELHFDAQEPAHSATLMIYDEDGDLVATRELGALEQGEGVVSWDGQTTDGSAAEAGQYTFSIAAFDSEGNPVEVEEHVVGTVTEMDYSSGTPQPSVDGVVVALSDILVLAASDEGDP